MNAQDNEWRPLTDLGSSTAPRRLLLLYRGSRQHGYTFALLDWQQGGPEWHHCTIRETPPRPAHLRRGLARLCAVGLVGSIARELARRAGATIVTYPLRRRAAGRTGIDQTVVYSLA